jgi:hypothetical protein
MIDTPIIVPWIELKMASKNYCKELLEGNTGLMTPMFVRRIIKIKYLAPPAIFTGLCKLVYNE